MQKTFIVATALAIAGSGALSGAQTPPQTQTPQQQTATQQPKQDQPTTTLTGCVYREKDIPGRSPNVAERAGVLEDYILAEISPSSSAAGTTGATGTTGSTETSGMAGAKSPSMFKLEFVDDDKLKTLVGKRVEVTGRIDSEAGDKAGTTATTPPSTPPTTQTDKVIGRDRVNIAEFEVTTIREVSGTCPATPSGR